MVTEKSQNTKNCVFFLIEIMRKFETQDIVQVLHTQWLLLNLKPRVNT